ncbi:MAG: type II toxin-antitoxin system antitoxin SocA domain-containing protein, partial [Desulfobaccales bacterium]
MISCVDVAKYFLSLTDEESGELISNLKLQKLVYYAQGFHLVFYDTPLFSERIEAWTYGPVVPDLYHEYKSHGPCSIPP